jgi:hypothetical protein
MLIVYSSETPKDSLSSLVLNIHRECLNYIMIHTLLNNLAMKKKERKFGQTMVEYSNPNNHDFQKTMSNGLGMPFQG